MFQLDESQEQATCQNVLQRRKKRHPTCLQIYVKLCFTVIHLIFIHLMLYYCVKSQRCTVGTGVNGSSPCSSLQNRHFLQYFLFPNLPSAPLEKKNTPI